MVHVVFLSRQSLVREMMEQVAIMADDIELIASAAEIGDIPNAHELRPDVVVADLNPSLFGLKLGQEIASVWPGVPMIALSSHCHEAAARQLNLAGFESCLSKDVGLEQLFARIRSSAHTRPRTLGTFAARTPGAEFRSVRLLTRRETEVLDMIARGFANKQVAAALHISPKTVEKHRQSVMKKLAVHETAGLTRCAFALGLGFGAQFEPGEYVELAPAFIEPVPAARPSVTSAV